MPEVNDTETLVTRLREWAGRIEDDYDPTNPPTIEAREEIHRLLLAADTIERLEAEVGKLREQLEKASTDASVFDKQRHEAEAKLATVNSEINRLRRLTWAALEREALQAGISLKGIREAAARDELRLAILKARFPNSP